MANRNRMLVIIKIPQLAFPTYYLIKPISDNVSHGVQVISSLYLLKDALNNKEYGLLRSVRFG